MRAGLVFLAVAVLMPSVARPQQGSSPAATPSASNPVSTASPGGPAAIPAPITSPTPSPADSALRDVFDSRIKTEWEAIKNHDKKTYGELLDDAYQGVEIDGQGERNKLQAINELTATNVFSYTLWGLKVFPLGPEATFVVYEVTLQFPPKSAVPFSRVYVGSVWVKRKDQWKELHYQETRVR